MPRRSPIPGQPDVPTRTSLSFIVFTTSLFDQVGRSEARPWAELMQSPSLPHQQIINYRIQVNLLTFCRNYINIMVLSLITTCFFLPWLTGAVVLAGLMHVDSVRRAAASAAEKEETAAAAVNKKKEDAGTTNAANDNSGGNDSGSSSNVISPLVSPTTSMASMSARDDDKKKTKAATARSIDDVMKMRIIGFLQAVNIVLLLFYYGVLSIILVLSLPALLVLLHATLTPYNDAASRQYEKHCLRLQKRSGSGSRSTGVGGDGSGRSGSGGGTFTPARPSTPVRRWGDTTPRGAQ